MQILFRLLSFTILVLTYGCTESCLEPDDFGFYTVTVPARYADKSKIQGSRTAQVVPWIDAGVVANGYPISILVKNWENGSGPGADINSKEECSAWSPWYGYGPNDKGPLSFIVKRLRTCNFDNSTMCTQDSDIANVINAPCLFKRGVGLYGLVTEYNPNESMFSMQKPSGKTFHVGQCAYKKCLDSNSDNAYEFYSINKKGQIKSAGGIIYDPRRHKDDAMISNQMTEQNKGSGIDPSESEEKYLPGKHKIYFKIMDRHYEDNSGQYIAYLKSGFLDHRSNFFSKATAHVVEIIFGSRSDTSSSDGIIPKMYKNTIGNSSFQTAVKAILVIYVIIYGIMFSIGAVAATQSDLISRVFKIIVLSTLISDASWEFFNSYLFTFFIDGSLFLKSIAEKGGGGVGNTDIIGMIFSSQVMTKLGAILLSSVFGLIYVIFFFAALGYFATIIYKAYVNYLISIIMLGLIVCVSPIFICLVLFNFTKNFFDNWFKQAIYYTIYPLFLFIGIGITSQIIKERLYMDLGFPVCITSIFTIPNFSEMFESADGATEAGTSILSWIVPKVAPKVFNNSKDANGEDILKVDGIPKIPVPYTAPKIEKVGTTERTIHYAPYELIDYRYPDLPYLDPQNAYHVEKIKQLTGGTFHDFSGLTIIWICLFLLSKYMGYAEEIARAVGNASFNAVKMQQMASTSMGAMAHSLDKYVAKGASFALRNAGRAVSKIGKIADIKALDKVGSAITGLGGIRQNIKDVSSAISTFKKKYASTEALKKIWTKNIVEKLEHAVFKDNPELLKKELKSSFKNLDEKGIEELKKLGLKDADGKEIDVTKLDFDAEDAYKRKIKEILKNANLNISYKKVNELTNKIPLTEDQKLDALAKHFVKQGDQSMYALKEFLLQNKFGLKDGTTFNPNSDRKPPEWIKESINDMVYGSANRKDLNTNKLLSELNMKTNSNIADVNAYLQKDSIANEKRADMLKLLLDKDALGEDAASIKKANDLIDKSTAIYKEKLETENKIQDGLKVEKEIVEKQKNLSEKNMQLANEFSQVQKDAQDRIQSLSKESQKISSEVESIDKKIDLNNKTIEKQSSTISELSKNIDDLTKQLENTSDATEISKIKLDIERLQEESERMQSEMEQNKQNALNMDKERLELRDELKEIAIKQGEISNEVNKTLEDINAKIEKTNEELRASIEELKDKQSEIRREKLAQNRIEKELVKNSKKIAELDFKSQAQLSQEELDTFSKMSKDYNSEQIEKYSKALEKLEDKHKNASFKSKIVDAYQRDKDSDAIKSYKERIADLTSRNDAIELNSYSESETRKLIFERYNQNSSIKMPQNEFDKIADKYFSMNKEDVKDMLKEFEIEDKQGAIDAASKNKDGFKEYVKEKINTEGKAIDSEVNNILKKENEPLYKEKIKTFDNYKDAVAKLNEANFKVNQTYGQISYDQQVIARETASIHQNIATLEKIDSEVSKRTEFLSKQETNLEEARKSYESVKSKNEMLSSHKKGAIFTEEMESTNMKKKDLLQKYKQDMDDIEKNIKSLEKDIKSNKSAIKEYETISSNVKNELEESRKTIENSKIDIEKQKDALTKDLLPKATVEKENLDKSNLEVEEMKKRLHNYKDRAVENVGNKLEKMVKNEVSEKSLDELYKKKSAANDYIQRFITNKFK